MSEELKYNRQQFQLDQDFLKSVTTLDPARSTRALILAWVQIAALILAARFLVPAKYFWYAYVPLIFFIAGRQGALLQLVHEASHVLLHPSRKVNDFISSWFCAYPIGITHEGYARGHYKHHAYTGTERDPKSDREKYRVPDVRDPRLYLLLLKDLLGISALEVFFAYGKNAEEVEGNKKDEGERESLFQKLIRLSIVQTILLAVLFQFNVLDYILLWLIPAMSPHMFLMRIRGIAEHGLAGQIGVDVKSVNEGTFYTRSFLTPTRHYAFAPFVWLEKLLIGSMSVHYHHEHHLFPSVPFYGLRTVHERISSEVRAKNPDVYVRGYFSAAMKNILTTP